MSSCRGWQRKSVNDSKNLLDEAEDPSLKDFGKEWLIDIKSQEGWSDVNREFLQRMSRGWHENICCEKCFRVSSLLWYAVYHHIVNIIFWLVRSQERCGILPTNLLQSCLRLRLMVDIQFSQVNLTDVAQLFSSFSLLSIKLHCNLENSHLLSMNKPRINTTATIMRNIGPVLRLSLWRCNIEVFGKDASVRWESKTSISDFYFVPKERSDSIQTEDTRFRGTHDFRRIMNHTVPVASMSEIIKLIQGQGSARKGCWK